MLMAVAFVFIYPSFWTGVYK